MYGLIICLLYIFLAFLGDNQNNLPNHEYDHNAAEKELANYDKIKLTKMLDENNQSYISVDYPSTKIKPVRM